MTTFTKDPNALLDYTVDWSAWLATGEVIDSVSWTVPTGITSAGTSNTDTTATIRLGTATRSKTYEIGCTITTSEGQIDKRTFSVTCQDR